LKDYRVVYFFLILSVIAMLLVLVLIGLTPSQNTHLSFSEKVGTVGVFIICCVFGISFTMKPNWVRRLVSASKDQEKNAQSNGERLFRGHHPDCSPFQNHTIQMNGKTLCAGCLGLSLGLFAAIGSMIVYTITDIQQTKTMSFLLLLLGLIFLMLVYIEIFYESISPILHVFLNSLMPLGFSLITIAVGGFTGEPLYGFFSILLCFLWLDTRIRLSKWRHSSICIQCPESCKRFLQSP
jgi:hypothetical protein